MCKLVKIYRKSPIFHLRKQTDGYRQTDRQRNTLDGVSKKKSLVPRGKYQSIRRGNVLEKHAPPAIFL